MRITIVQGAFLPVPPVLGGAVEKIWFALGKEFVRRGHQVTHISRRHGTFACEEPIDGVHHIRIRGFDFSGSLVQLKWRDLLYSRNVLAVLPEADILVTNTFWLPILAPETKNGRIYVHVQRYPKGQMKFYGKAARLQTVSTVMGMAICSEAPKLATKVKVIPNFVSRVKSTPLEHKRHKYILYVGRLHPEKGIHLLIEAFARFLSMGFTEWKLRLVGPWKVIQGGGGEQFVESMRKKARGIDNSIEWTGPVFDAEELSRHYQQASVFVYPSLAGRGEASPLAPLEAMAEGCPPVVSSLDCFRDYIRPGCNGWSFDHRGTHGAINLANILRSAVTEPDALIKVAECAMRTARNYTLPRVADRYLSDFEEIARR